MVSTDHYAGAGSGWATGASLVYAPIAVELIAMGPPAWEGRTVLDVGAGTGVASDALRAAGASPIAVDLSWDMLAWERSARVPSAVADVGHLPLRAGAVDDVVAAFVLNHLADPVAGLAELIGAVRGRGSLLATVYSTASQSDARDRVDELARDAGWQVPDWYVQMKADTVPLLGRGPHMEAAARRAGLVDIRVEEREVDVGVVEPEQLVDYRFGQAQFTSWLASIGPQRAEQVRRDVAGAIGPIMEPYRPIVVFLAARVR
jgi:SAM-dependent methyltransferase